MATNIFLNFIDGFDNLYKSFPLTDKISELIFNLTAYQDYLPDFKYYMSGVYFIFGKPLCTYVVGVAFTVLAIRIITAIINVVWP